MIVSKRKGGSMNPCGITSNVVIVYARDIGDPIELLGF